MHTSLSRPVPPAIPAGNESLAFIVVTENDDARGIIQLTSSEVNTTEPSQEFINLTRSAGDFGEVGIAYCPNLKLPFSHVPIPTPIPNVLCTY